MIEHMVIFRAKEGKGAELLAALQGFVDDIKPRLPGLIELTTGVNNNQRSLDQGWSHGLYARFRDRATEEAYTKDAVHQTLMGATVSLRDDVVPMDYEVPSSA